jgi:hypothetical protein
MAGDDTLGVRYILNGTPAYGNVRSVMFAQEFLRPHIQAVFVEVAPREVLEQTRTTVTVGRKTNASVYIEALTCLTHIIKFTQHPGTYGQPEPKKIGVPPAGQYLCLTVWATRPGWEGI